MAAPLKSRQEKRLDLSIPSEKGGIQKIPYFQCRETPLKTTHIMSSTTLYVLTESD